MQKAILGFFALVTVGSIGDARLTAADEALDRRYAAIVTETCIERGKMGTTPETLTRNCTCVADIMAEYVPLEIKAHSVQKDRFDDSEWAEIRDTPAESQISEGLYQDCAMSYSIIQQWP